METEPEDRLVVFGESCDGGGGEWQRVKGSGCRVERSSSPPPVSFPRAHEFHLLPLIRPGADDPWEMHGAGLITINCLICMLIMINPSNKTDVRIARQSGASVGSYAVECARGFSIG